MQATINGAKIAFEDAGRGPAVILIHDFLFNRTMWDAQVAALAANGYRVIAPDLRGCGESEKGDKPFNIRTLADDIAKLMKHLGIGRAVLVGMALGGEVVLELLKRHPRQVVAANLVAPLLPPADAAERNRLWSLAELVREGHPETALDGLSHWFFGGEAVGQKPESVASFRSLCAAVAPDVLARGLTLWEQHQGRTGRRERHAHPVLLLTAEHDPVSPPERTGTLLRLLSRGRHQVQPGADRLLTISGADQFNACLLDFLAEISECKPGRLRLAALRLKAGLSFNKLQDADEEEAENIGEGIAPA